MYKKKILKWLAVVAVFAMLLSACGGAETPEVEPTEPEPTEVEPTEVPPTEESEEEPTEAEPTEVEAPSTVQVCAMLAVGLDQGWDRTFIESFERVVNDPPAGLEVKELKYTEGLWGDEAKAAMIEYAESGECDIIWPHGGYNDIIDELKTEYPEIMWVEVGSGYKEYGGNNYHFWLRCHEPSYLMGLLAGHLSDTSVFGGVGTYPASDVNDSLNAFFEGAKSVKGEIEQKVAFINSWYDPGAANEAARAQIAAGAEHIDMYAETFDAISEEGAIGYGAYNDYSETYPDSVLASFVTEWDAAIRWAFEEWVAAKTGEGFDAPDSPTYTLSNSGSCDVALNEELLKSLEGHEEALDAFEEAREAIIDGSLEVPLDDSQPESD